LSAASGWDEIRTIFPFLLRSGGDAGKARYLDRTASETIHRLLAVDATAALRPAAVARPIAAMRCQVGQPVACGSRDGQPVSALRLCASARLVVEAAAQGADT